MNEDNFIGNNDEHVYKLKDLYIRFYPFDNH